MNCIDDELRIIDEVSKAIKSGGEIHRVSKKGKTCNFDVWKHFTKFSIKEGKEKAKCNGYKQEYVNEGTKIG